MNSSKRSDGNPPNEFQRLIAAFGYSFEGLKAVLPHPAFRAELLASAVMAPIALVLGDNGMERALLIGCLFLVLIVELLNTAVETAIDRISKEHHPLSKLAKDIGSAAVLLSLVNAGVIWFLIVLT
jgi:diacylglycerol kinase (ATP)